MITPSHLHGYPDQKLPHFMVLNIADLIEEFQSNWKNATAAGAPYGFDTFKPDINHVVRMTIDSIQHEQDAEMDLAMMAFNDLASMPHIGMQTEIEVYSTLHLSLAGITENFGRAVINRMKEDGIYRAGYIPYHFCGWLGQTVVIGLNTEHGGVQIPPPEGVRPEYVHF